MAPFSRGHHPTKLPALSPIVLEEKGKDQTQCNPLQPSSVRPSKSYTHTELEQSSSRTILSVPQKTIKLLDAPHHFPVKHTSQGPPSSVRSRSVVVHDLLEVLCTNTRQIFNQIILLCPPPLNHIKQISVAASFRVAAGCCDVLERASLQSALSQLSRGAKG